MSRDLSPRELFKYDYRVNAFLEKYKKEEPFKLLDGEQVSFVFTEYITELIEHQKINELRGPILLGKDNTYYRLSDLEKTKEFGGKGEGFGVRIEERQISNFNTKHNNKNLPIKIGDSFFYVKALEKTPGTPKSDFHFIDISDQEIVWMSHKDGKRATDFQQYGGLTEKEILMDEETQDFIHTVQKKFPAGINRATTVARKIGNTNLKMKAIYGVEFGQPYGKQNVNVMLQGDLQLVECSDYLELSAYHVHYNGQELDDEYEPVFMASYKGDRSQFDVKGARFSISPIGSRKINEFI